MKRAIYLDYAAATPLDPEVLTVMQPYFRESFYNPSALYRSAVQVSQAVQSAREAVAKTLGVRAGEIIFTSGATEANNLAIQGVVNAFPEAHIVTTALEHESVLQPSEYLRSRGYTVTEVKPQPDGLILPAAIAAAITDQTVLVSVMYANNEVGTIQPIRAIAAELVTIRERRKQQGNDRPLYFHTDAAQAANYLDIAPHRLGVDLLSLNGGKLYGPKQSGLLYVANHVQLTPLIFGGGQEQGRRSGTENVAGIIGFSAALTAAQKQKTVETKRLQALQQEFVARLTDTFPDSVINGSLKTRLPNNLHFTLPGQDNERLLFALDDAGIQVATGSACSASKEEASHVLLAMGLRQADARASLRVSMGRFTTIQDITQFIKTLRSII